MTGHDTPADTDEMIRRAVTIADELIRRLDADTDWIEQAARRFAADADEPIRRADATRPHATSPTGVDPMAHPRRGAIP